MIAMVKEPNIQIYGYCEKGPTEIASYINNGNLVDLKYLDGEFTIVIESDGSCTIVTSPVGAIQYFYKVDQQNFYHADSVLEVLKQASSPWRWNWEALGDLCQLENLTNNQTLHPDVKRVPPGCILTFKNYQLSTSQTSYIDTIREYPADPDVAVQALNDEVARWAGDQPYLSLSGGFDSRVILSSLLKQGIKPHLITMGKEGCSDVETARQIATRFSLNHSLIELDLTDLLTHAQEISRITNGTKTAWHWHTYLYPLKAKIPKDKSFFVGTLGEFARSYYFDRGKIGLVGNILAPLSLEAFWKVKLKRHPTFEDNELYLLADNFREQLDKDGVDKQSKKLVSLCHHQFLSGLTRYYFEQRVPNFYANGIKMYLASSNWRSPFHSLKWIDAVWNLPFSWKLGSNWHRYAIAKNYPELLAFPEENGFKPNRMLRKAPPFYWSSLVRRTPYVSYDQSEAWFGSKLIQDQIKENMHCIEEIINPRLVIDVLSKHLNGQSRTRTMAFILTMIHFKLNIMSILGD